MHTTDQNTDNAVDKRSTNGEVFSADFNEVYRNQPASPVSRRECEISVVSGTGGRGIRCVYVNNRRVVGGKPYVSENLSSIEKLTTVSEVLDAFSDADILAYMAEKEERAAYFARYHAWKAATALTS